MSNIIDLTGKRFGRLVVERRVPGTNGQARWRSLCDCGRSTECTSQTLRLGHSRSCGCLSAEMRRFTSRTHGRARTPEYVAWNAMKSRCLNPNDAGFKNYGGRGIAIDPRWLSSFATFYADMGPRPTPEHSIDRIDNDGPYAPGNCRWADRVTQNRHKRSAVLLTLDGRTQSVVEWAEELGVPQQRIRNRLRKGESAAVALRPEVARTGLRGAAASDAYRRRKARLSPSGRRGSRR